MLLATPNHYLIWSFDLQTYRDICMYVCIHIYIYIYIYIVLLFDSLVCRVAHCRIYPLAGLRDCSLCITLTSSPSRSPCFSPTLPPSPCFSLSLFLLLLSPFPFPSSSLSSSLSLSPSLFFAGRPRGQVPGVPAQRPAAGPRPSGPRRRFQPPPRPPRYQLICPYLAIFT